MALSTFFFLLALPVLANVRAHGSTFGLDLHHCFSDKVRDWAQSTSLDFKDWPKEGTSGYYAALVAQDRARLRGRGLVDLTFAGGNKTTRFNHMGFLHYAEVELGTPGVTFLVALDTGSDLFWVPCDCTNCAPTSNREYKLKFNIFNSTASSTSKRVPCNSSLCDLRKSCTALTDNCPFKVQYVDNSSTSGILLQDVLHFTKDGSQREPIQATVTFGCGQHQPDTFNHSTPNGILGLGLGKTSVPTTLYDTGLISADSFSMCFSRDGSGRIRFGDSGSPDQNTTQFHPDVPSLYVVTVTDVKVGGYDLNAQFNAFFDTGSSFTILKDPVYSVLTQQFDRYINRQRVFTDSQSPFEYCYAIGSNEETISYPRLSFTMKGGKEFALLRPVLLLGGEHGNAVGFCLGIMQSSQINIIGQNFMTGYKLVFDGGNSVLGWKEFDCYKNMESPSTHAVVDVGTRGSSVPPLLCQSLLSSISLFLLPLLTLFSL